MSEWKCLTENERKILKRRRPEADPDKWIVNRVGVDFLVFMHVLDREDEVIVRLSEKKGRIK